MTEGSLPLTTSIFHSKLFDKMTEGSLPLTTSISSSAGQTQTPLPKRTLAVLCFVILAEPISMTILFPFIYFMVRDFHLGDEKETGFYVGFIASSFSLAQFLTSVFWGILSDKIGRRPVLLVGLVGNTVFNLTFGLSHSLTWALTSRFLCGFLNGNIGVAKCIMGEITDATNKALGFSYMSLVWGIGMIWGPMLGGFLSNPVEKYPWLFGNSIFLQQNPYFLPCAFSASFSMIGFVVGFFCLEESKPKQKRTVVLVAAATSKDIEDQPSETTPLLLQTDSSESVDTIVIEDSNTHHHPQQHQQQHQQASSSSSSVACGNATPPIACSPTSSAKKSTRYLSPATIMCITNYALFAFYDIIFNEIFSIWMVTPIAVGGLGYNSSDVGLCLSMMGGLTLFIQLCCYPWLDRRFSSLRLYQFAFPFQCIVPFAFVFVTHVASSNDWHGLTWWLVLFFQAIRHIANVVSFTGTNLLINNTASPSKAGLIMGLAQTSVAFVRSIGPAAGGITWSWSLSNGLPFPLNHDFTFLALTTISIIVLIHALFIPASANEKVEEEVEEED